MNPYQRAKRDINKRLADDAKPMTREEIEAQMEALKVLYGAPRRQVEMPMSWIEPVNGDDGVPEE